MSYRYFEERELGVPYRSAISLKLPVLFDSGAAKTRC